VTPNVSERGAADLHDRVRRAFLERSLDDELGETGGGTHERHDIMIAGEEVS